MSPNAGDGRFGYPGHSRSSVVFAFAMAHRGAVDPADSHTMPLKNQMITHTQGFSHSTAKVKIERHSENDRNLSLIVSQKHCGRSVIVDQNRIWANFRRKS
jgi:hypothetical protein